MRHVRFFMLPLLFAVTGCIFVEAAFPDDIAVPEVKAESSAAVLARGEYLFHHVAGCAGCHSERDWNAHAAPIKEGTLGKGGEAWDERAGFPGALYGKNITPAALSTWTDGEILRATTSGISKDGTPLFPIMPYEKYGHASKDDMLAIVAYMRTLAPIESTIPERRLEGPLGFIVRAMPKEAALVDETPKPGDAAFPAYVTNLAGCLTCHTEADDRGQLIEGKHYAGGRAFPMPTGGVVRSANLTPDDETGLGRWTREAFVARFKATTVEVARAQPVAAGTYNTLMPWTEYAGMTEEDLGGIYDYLRALPPQKNLVEKFTADVTLATK